MVNGVEMIHKNEFTWSAQTKLQLVGLSIEKHFSCRREGLYKYVKIENVTRKARYYLRWTEAVSLYLHYTITMSSILKSFFSPKVNTVLQEIHYVK